MTIQRIALRIRARVATVTSIIVLAIVDCLGVVYLSEMTGLASIERTTDPFSPDLFDSNLGRAADRTKLELALSSINKENLPEEARALKITRWVTEQVSSVGNTVNSRSSWELVQNAHNGSGLVCGHMSQILHDALIVSDIPARRVMLITDLVGLGETHVVVEAFVGGRWIVLDPTFHLTLRNSDRLRISAIEAQELTQTIGHQAVQIEFLGETTYPARVTNYYYNYLSIYRHALIETRMGHASRRLPVVTYWTGPVWRYHQVEGFSSNPVIAYNILYHVIMLIFPILIFCITLTLFIPSRSIGKP